MNQDNTPPENPPENDPVQEARIVAWIAGDASPFEIAELERLVSENPELAIFKRRIETVQDLVGEAVRPEKEPLRLSPERRAKLFAAIGAPSSSPDSGPTQSESVLPFPSRLLKARRSWLKGLSVACCFMLALMTLRREWPRPGRHVSPEAFFRKEKQEVVVALPQLAADSAEIVQSENELSLQKNAEDRTDRLISGKNAPGVTLSSQPPILRPSGGFAVSLPAAPTFGSLGSSSVRHEPASEIWGRSKGVSKANAFVANAPLDTDLNGRIDLARGPNSITFGLGSPAGITNDNQLKTSHNYENTDSNYAITDPSAFNFYKNLLDGPNKKEWRDWQAVNVAVDQTFSGDRLAFKGSGGHQAYEGTNQWLTGSNYAINVDVNASYADSTPNPNAGHPFVANAASNPDTAFSTDRNIVRATATGELRAEDFLGKTKLAEILGRNAIHTPDHLLAQNYLRDADDSSDAFYGTATLAGTRVKPNFKDVASSLSPVTEPTLNDSVRLNEPSVLSLFVVEADKNSAPSANTSDRKVTAQPADMDAAESDNASPAPARKKSLAKPSPTIGESDAASEPVSTFSLHVGDVSFRLAQAALARGDRPDPASIRPEEFYNAFDYGDPAPALGEKISCHVEQSTHPELQQRNLLRVALRVPSTGRGAGQPLRLTVLLDTSGSMQREDRAAAVQRAMEVVVSLLGPSDRITLIGFARQPRLLAESISGDQAKGLLKIIAEVPAEGGTNLEEALKLAAELARRQQDFAAQNRIVLLTDGAANLGDADPAKLASSIETLRQEGIAFDACGVGLEGIDDTMLEALTRHGDGRYTVLTTPESAELDFARQLAGAFRPAAQNVKVQVRFNSARVAHYRLIGFEQHRLNEEDFRNDKVDAAELAADEAAVAVYEVEARPEGEGELGEVYVRFRDTATGNMIERSWPLPYDAHVTAFDRSSSTMQLAGTAALVAESLQGAPIKLEDLAGPVNALRGRYSHELRVQELVAMYEELRRSDHSEK